MSEGSHERFDREEEVEGSSDRSFGFVFAAVFAAIGFAPLLHGGMVRVWPLPVAGLFLAIAVLRPAVLAPLNGLWRRFGLLLHRIVNPLIMGLMFFAAVTPTAWVLRLFGKRPLKLQFESKVDSYWIPRNPPGPPPESIRRQF